MQNSHPTLKACTFDFVRDLDMYYLPSRIQHALLEIQISEQNKARSTIFYGRSDKNIMHFYLRDLDIGGYALPFLNPTRTAILMESICGVPSLICSGSV